MMNKNLDLFSSSLSAPGDGPLVVAYGAGVDSTAMLVLLQKSGIRPDLICFADTGAEKPETIQYLDVMNDWLDSVGFPRIDVVRKKTLPSTPYNDLAGNCLDNETLPSLAFGMKSCSIKWKHKPQDQYLMGCKSGPAKCDPHPVWESAKASGKKVIKLIGYDASPADIRRAKKAPIEDDNFLYWYPLIDMDIKRPQCVELIIEAGLPVPVKSACFFCPASKKWELYWLAGKHPALFERALELEYGAMIGRHSRFDSIEFGDDWENLIRGAKSFPSSDTTVGLGRSFAWNHWARVERIVNDAGKVIADSAWLLKMADQEKDGDGGNAADARNQNKIPLKEVA